MFPNFPFYIVLILVIPGFIANYVRKDLTKETKPKSQLEEFAYIILCSFFIMIFYNFICITFSPYIVSIFTLLSNFFDFILKFLPFEYIDFFVLKFLPFRYALDCYYIIILFFENFSKIESFYDLQKQLLSIKFTFIYVIFAIFGSFISGIFIYIFNQVYLWLINQWRRLNKLEALARTDTLFNILINDGKDHVIEIIDKDRKYKGFRKLVSPLTEEVYITLINDINKKWRNYFTYNDIDGIYFNLNNNIRIVNYNIKRFNIMKMSLTLRFKINTFKNEIGLLIKEGNLDREFYLEKETTKKFQDEINAIIKDLKDIYIIINGESNNKIIEKTSRYALYTSIEDKIRFFNYRESIQVSLFGQIFYLKSQKLIAINILTSIIHVFGIYSPQIVECTYIIIIILNNLCEEITKIRKTVDTYKTYNDNINIIINMITDMITNTKILNNQINKISKL